MSVTLLGVGLSVSAPRALAQVAPWLGGVPDDYEGCVPSPEDGIFCGGDGPPPFTGPLTTLSISSSQPLTLTTAYLAATNYQYNVSNGATLTVTGPEELGTLSASFSGQGSFLFAGGQLRLIYNNSLAGDFIIGSGRLVLDASVPFANMNTMIVAGGTLAFGTSNPSLGIVQVNGNGQLELLSGSSVSIGAFTGTGPVKISGPGSMDVRGNSSFTGGVQLSGGVTLGVNWSDTLGAAGQLVLIGADSGLRFNRNFTLDHPVEGTGGKFHLIAAEYVHVNVDAPVSGAGELLLKGSGATSEFTLSQANRQTGGLAIENSTVHFTTDDNLGATGGKVSFYQGGVLTAPANFTSDRPLVFAAGTGSVSVDSGTVTLSGTMSGAGEFAKQGAGTLILSGVNSATGGLHVAQGTVRLAASNALPTGRLKIDGTLELNGHSTTGGSLAGTGTIALGGSTLTLQQDTAQSFSGQITGTGGLTKTGSATLTLLTPLAYSGATTVRAGTLAAGAAQVFSASSALFINDGALVSLNGYNQTVGDLDSYDATTGLNDTGTVHLGGATLTNLNRVTNNWAGTLTGTGTLIKKGTATMNWFGQNDFTGTLQIDAGTVSTQTLGTLSPNAVVAIASGASLNLNGGAQTIGGLSGAGTVSLASGALTSNQTDNSTFAGVITGTGRVAKGGAGTLTLATANTYSGGTTVNLGTLVAGHASAFGTGTVRVNAGTLDLANLAVSNALDVRGGSLTGLTNYTGTQTLSAAMTYSGTVGGSMLVASSGALNTTGATFTGATTVQSGGRLSGTGSLASLTLNSGATLSPGNSPGTLTAGNTTWNGGANYVWEINNAANPQSPGSAGTSYDLLAISGTLTINATAGNKFTLTLASLLANNTAGDVINFNSALNSSYTIASATGGIIGFDANAFTINASGFTNALNGGSWSLGLANSNRDLALNFTAAASAIPEPSTYAAIFGALVLGLTIYRQRQRRL